MKKTAENLAEMNSFKNIGKFKELAARLPLIYLRHLFT